MENRDRERMTWETGTAVWVLEGMQERDVYL